MAFAEGIRREWLAILLSFKTAPKKRPPRANATFEATAASIHALYEPTRRAFIEVYRHDLVS